MNNRFIKILYSAICVLIFQTAGSQSPLHDALLRSVHLRNSGRFAEALKLADSVLNAGTDYRILLEKGEAELGLSRYDEAMESFRKASDARKHSGAFGLARVYAVKGDAVTSLRYLEENLASGYRAGDRACHSDRFLAKIELRPEWKRYWEKERHSPAEVILDEVTYLISRGMTEEAELLLEAAGHDELGTRELVYARSLVAYAKGDFKSTVNLLTDAGDYGNLSYRANRLLADSYLAAGDYRQAISVYTSLINAETPDLNLFSSRASGYRGLMDFGRAMTDLNYYLSINAGDGGVLRAAASVAAEAGDTGNSLRLLNRLISAEPGNREAWVERGNMWSTTGMWNNAISDYAMALDLDPVDGDVYLRKAEALMKTGNTAEACSDLRMALRYGNRKASEIYNRHCIK